MQAPPEITPDTPSSALHKLARQLSATEELSSFRQRENDRLASELRTVEARLADKVQAATVLQRMVDEAEAARVNDQLEIKRLRREVEMQTKHAERERQDAEARSLELAEQRKNAGAARLALLNELDKARLDKEAAESGLLNANQQIARLRAQQTDFEAALTSARESVGQVQASSDAQLAQQSRIIDQLKQTLVEADKDKQRVDARLAQANAQLAAADEDKARLVQQAMAQVNLVEQAAAEAAKSYEAKIAQLEARLQPDQGTLELVGLSPSLATEQLQRQGLTLTGLYTRVAQEHEARVQAESEVGRLNGYLNRIMHEIESKAPELTRLRAEHQAALASHDAMADKLVVALQDCAALRSNNVELARRCEEAQQEAAQCKQEAKDLALQVQSLLSSSSGAGAGAGAGIPPGTLSSSAQASSSASDVISDSLVPFRNVAELQQRNQQLLRVVRQLSALEEELRSRPDEAGLARAMEEIKKLDEARQRQEDMVHAIVKQRDMYRALLAQADSKHRSLEDQASPSATSSTSYSASSSSTDIARLREEMAIMTREHLAQLDSLRSELAAARTLRAQAETARDFLNSRVTSLTELHDEAVKEAERGRAQLATCHSQMLELQSALGARAHEVADAQAAQRRAEAVASDLQADVKLLRGETEQAKQRVSSLEDQRNAQRALCDRLEAQLAAREKEAADRLRQLESERDSAVKAHSDAQLSVREALQQATQVSSQAMQERVQMQNKLDEATEQVARLQRDLAKETSEREALLRSDALLREQLKQAARQPMDADDARAQVDLANAEVARLNELLASKTRDVESLRAIAQANEEACALMERSLNELKTKTAQAEQAAEEERVTVRAEMNLAHRKLDEAVRARAKAEDEAKKAVARVGELEEALKQAEWKLSGAADDLKRFAHAAKTAETNYARELQLHAGDAAALVALRSQADKAEDARLGAEKDAALLREREASLKSARAQLEAQLAARSAELDDLRAENRLLASQLSRVDAAAPNEPGSAGELQQLWNKQRDRLVLEKEEAALALSACKAQLEQASRELERMRAEAKASDGAKVLTEAEHQRLMAAVHENSLLRGVNASLNKDSETLRSAIAAAEAKMARALEELEAARRAQAQSRAEALAAVEESASRARECKLLQQRLDDVVRRLGGEAGASKEETEKAMARIAQLEGELAAATAQLNEAVEARTKLETDTTTLRQNEKNLRDFAQKRKAALDEKQALLAKAEELAKTAETQRDEAAKERDEAKAALAPSETEMNRLRVELQRKNDVLERFRAQVKVLREENEQLKTAAQAQSQATPEPAAAPVAAPSPVAPVVVSPEPIPVEAAASLSLPVVESSAAAVVAPSSSDGAAGETVLPRTVPKPKAKQAAAAAAAAATAAAAAAATTAVAAVPAQVTAVTKSASEDILGVAAGGASPAAAAPAPGKAKAKPVLGAPPAKAGKVSPTVLTTTVAPAAAPAEAVGETAAAAEPAKKSPEAEAARKAMLREKLALAKAEREKKAGVKRPLAGESGEQPESKQPKSEGGAEE